MGETKPPPRVNLPADRNFREIKFVSPPLDLDIDPAHENGENQEMKVWGR